MSEKDLLYVRNMNVKKTSLKCLSNTFILSHSSQVASMQTQGKCGLP